jgi:uncharacterized protein YkwD
MGVRTTGVVLGFLLAVACASTPEARVAGVDSLSGHAAFVAEPAPPEVRARSRLREDLEARVLTLANRIREIRGAPVLTPRYDLREVARGHARDMADRAYFSHTSPEGNGPGERARHLRFVALGENLARVRNAEDPAFLAVRGWLGSPSHRRVLLDERGVNYEYTGIGAAVAPDGTVYVAQVFLK